MRANYHKPRLTTLAGCALSFALLLPAGPCWAWGPQGHATVGLIAEHFLTPAAKRALDDILDGQSLGDNRVANWPDYIRGNKKLQIVYPENAKWHFIDIDVATADADVALPPDGNDVIDQVVRWQKELARQDLLKSKRRDAVGFLVHFTADLHQPLHCSCRDHDRGGNEVPVHSFHGNFEKVDRESAKDRPNLHKTWDEYLVLEAMTGRTVSKFAEDLIAEIPSGAATGWRRGDPKQWALESHRLAVDRVYKFSDGSPVPLASAGQELDLTRSNYITASLPVVREQLQKAGVRLADLLNKALDASAAQGTTRAP